MATKHEIVVALDEIRGIRYRCPICRRELSMSRDEVCAFYIRRDGGHFCGECAREGDVLSGVDFFIECLVNLAQMVAGRSDLKRMDLSLVVDGE
jgi:hypothetical protein